MSDGYPEQPDQQSGHAEQLDHDGPAEADPRVEAAVRRLDELAERPLTEHVEVYESVHRNLHESLAEAAEDAQPVPPTEPGLPR